MIAVSLGAAVSLCLGVADFLGGTKARMLPAPAVVASAQAVGLAALLLVLAAARPPLPEAPQIAAAAAAGLCVCVGTTALYKGLAVGTMGIVAPISATSALVPVAVGVAGGEALSPSQAAGIAIAVLGVVLASRSPGPVRSAARSGGAAIGFALLAAVGGGAFIVAMDSAGADNAIWAAALARATALSLLISATRLVLRSDRRPTSLAPDRAIAAIGLLETLSWVMLVLATGHGLLSVVGVLVSLYPVVTVILARSIYAERLRGSQVLGVIAVLVGVALLAAA